MDAPSRAAPALTREEVARSLSMPILDSLAAQEARAGMEARAAARPQPPHTAPPPREGPVTATHSTRAPLGGAAAAKAGSRRPGTAAAPTRGRSSGGAGAASSRPSTAAGGSRRGAGSGSSSATGSSPRAALMPRKAADGESFTALQLKTLEAEMAHLRATIDVLLEAKGVVAPPAEGSSSGSSSSSPQGRGVSPVSSLRLGESSLAAGAAAAGITERSAAALALHQENMALPSVSATLSEKQRHDARLAALRRESSVLRDPATMAAAAGSHYTRDSMDPLMEPTPATSSAPLAMPSPVPASASSPAPGGRRASLSSRRNSLASAGAPLEGGAGGRSGRSSSSSSSSSSGLPRAPVGGGSSGGGATSTSNLPSSPSMADTLRSTAGSLSKAQAYLASTSGTGAGAASSSRSRSSSARKAQAGAPRQRSAASPAPAAAAAAAALGATGSGSPSSPSRKPSRKELESMYSGLPGLSKQVAGTTRATAFSFTAPGSPRHSIREAKVHADIAAAAAELESHLHYKFKAGPIAPATADLGLFARIMAKQEARRELEHAQKAAYAAAHFRPFDIVNGHCEEAAARAAARRAKEEVEVARELKECVKFKANRLSGATARPEGMVLVQRSRKKKVVEVRLAKAREVFVSEPVTVWMPTREVGREERIRAEGRASAALASLPPRMALAVEEQARKDKEREARLAEEERLDRLAHAFHPAPAPNFEDKQARFQAMCDKARMAVTAARAASTWEAFSFDTPAAKAAQAARRDRWVKEAELATSTAMPLRKLSSAYAEGQDLVGDGGGRPASASASSRLHGGGLKGTLGVNPLLEATAAMSALTAKAASLRRRPASAGASLGSSGAGGSGGSEAPPAAMTKSVRLKMAAVQARLREAQEAQLAAERADEAYARVDRQCSVRLGPTFSAMERERLTEYDSSGAPVGVRQLSWYLDSVTATASERAAHFRAASARTAADLKARVQAAQQDRPLVMQRATLQLAKDKARVGALLKTARALGAVGGGGGSSYRASAEHSGMFDEDERALLDSVEVQEGGGSRGGDNAG